MLPVSRSNPMDDETKSEASGSIGHSSCMSMATVALISGFLAFQAGTIVGRFSANTDRKDHEADLVDQIIEANPEKFRLLRVRRGHFRGSSFVLDGTVETEADLAFLRDELNRTLNEERADYRNFEVDIRDRGDGG